MQYRRLGQTNLWVSAVGFGTCQLRRVPQDQALATLQQGFDLGVNFVHTAPDYEGADALVAEAIRHAKHDVHICTQAYDTHGNTHGFVNHFEHLFEEACVRFDRPKIDIFGIACIDDREALGENVWGPKGMVEFLQRKKQEGRIGAIFCTTHGGPDYVETLLKRNIFDALMIAYNPLGFHLLSYSPPPGRHFEHLPSVPAKIFPLAQALGTGLMIMKPLAGGLLCPSKAFPPRTQTTEHSDLSASHILRAILEHDAVSCVVPGTASVAEAEENARAGHGRQPISQGDRDNLHRQVQRLQTTLCSRCGLCDELCSQKLPVSWLFRGGYVNLFPGETFETWDEVEYFHLHPAAQPICSTCPSVTCKCPYGIDIPRSLVKIHEQMTVLKAKGHVCQP
ncbi:MAG: aldo/keto reductase, partial [Cyanobacteria bacterium P01_A01_bin.135]